MAALPYREGVALIAFCVVASVTVPQESHRPKDEVAVRSDVYGDRLPPGALVRMGSVQMRHAVSMAMPLVFSRDGKTIVSASGVDRKLRGWDVNTWQERFTRALPISDSACPELAFSVDGTKVAARVNHTRLLVCDVTDGKRLHEFEAPLSFAKQIALSSDGRLLATGHSNFSILIWDTATGKKREFRADDRQLAHDVFFSPDDRRVAMVSHDAITVFDVASGKRLRTFPNQMSLVSTQVAAFTPDGKTLAAWITAKDSGVVLYDVDSGKELWRIRGHGYPVLFSPDGAVLATGGADSIHLWDVATKKELHVIEKSGNPLAFAPDGRRLAFRRAAAIALFDLTTGKLTADDRGHRAEPSCITFSPDGRTLASAYHAGDVRLWESATGKQLRALRGEGGGLNLLALTSKLLIAGSGDGTVMRWHPADGKAMPPLRVPGERRNLDLRRSHDGTVLVATTYFPEDDKSYPLSGWDLESGKELFKRREAAKPLFPAFVSRAGKPLAHPAFVNIAAHPVRDGLRLSHPIALSPDGKIVALSRRAHDPDPDGRIFPNPVEAIGLYASATAKLLRRIDAGPLGDLCFSPDSRYLVASTPDRLRLWEVVSGLELFVRPAHERFVRGGGWFGGAEGDSFAGSLAFAPDCRRVATGLADSTILLWDMTPPPPHAPADAKALAALWADLGGADGRAIHAAVWAFVAAGDTGVAFLKARLPPTPFPDAKRVRQLLDELNSDRFKVREAALRNLRALGEDIVPFLDEAQKEKRSLEFHNRIESLRDGLRVVQSAETLRRLRAVQALEYIGTPAARRLLAELAKGSGGSRVTQDARASLQRLAHRE